MSAAANIFDIDTATMSSLDKTPLEKRFPCDVFALLMFWHDREEYPFVNEQFIVGNDIVSVLSMGYTPNTEYEHLYHPEKRYLVDAQVLRSYYINRYAMSAMLGEQFTDFQKAHSKVMNADKDVVLLDHIGIYASLLRMYQNDLDIDKAIKNFTPADDYDLAGQITTTLTFHSKKHRSYGGPKKIEYWFTDPNNVLYRAYIPTHTSESYYIDKILEMNDNKININMFGKKINLLNRDFTCISLGGSLKIC